MAALTIRSNINIVSAKIIRKLQLIKDREYLLRPVAFDVIALMTDRIHQQGKASDGNQIGTYSSGYMKIRTGNFQNSKRVTKGANKGKIKDSGIVTKKKVQLFGTTQSVFADVTPMGKRREQYNRSGDTKVIISLTRQLENDWSVIATPKGYGIGFLNELNRSKAGWVEETYDKKIFNLTESEKEFVTTRLQELIRNALHP